MNDSQSTIRAEGDTELELKCRLPRFRKDRYGLLTFFGVFLPLEALIVELAFAPCRGLLFDPIPTLLHTALILLVPVTVMLCIRALKGKSAPRSIVLELFLGAALAVSLIYTLLFAPVMPLGGFYAAMSWIAAFLPVLFVAMIFSPLTALLVLFRLKSKLSRRGLIPERLRVLAAGAALAAAALACAEVPRAAANYALKEYAKDPENVRVLTVARTAASRSVLLDAAYGNPAEPDFVTWFSGLSGKFPFIEPGVRLNDSGNKTAAELYFRVTGNSHSAEERPISGNFLFGPFGRLDTDLGGAAVGGRVPDLQLRSLTADSSISSAVGSAYTEQTFVFENEGEMQAEARFELLLPPRSVVSKASLWIKGEERQAAFGKASAVRAAYERVVRQSRDPLLITSAGPDRVLVQCFPVPAHEQMQIRIGVTSELERASEKELLFRLPEIVDRNFTVAKSLKEAVWVESDRSFTARSAGLSSEGSETGWTVRHAISPLGPSPVFAVRHDGAGSVLSADIDSSQLILKEWRTVHQKPASRLIIVLDGLNPLEASRGELSDALIAAASGRALKLLFAGDQPEAYESGDGMQRAISKAVSNVGGDSPRALAAALAEARSSTRVLWIHGPQPVDLSSRALLEQWIARRGETTKVLSLQVVSGPNKLLELPLIQAFRRRDENLKDYILRAANSETSYTAEYSQLSRIVAGSPEHHASLHPARLWAMDKVAELLKQGESGRSRASDLGTKYRIVTAASGAVVLETAQEYTAAGLAQPPTGSQVPIVPEPETYLLIAAALVSVLPLLKQKKPRVSI